MTEHKKNNHHSRPRTSHSNEKPAFVIGKKGSHATKRTEQSKSEPKTQTKHTKPHAKQQQKPQKSSARRRTVFHATETLLNRPTKKNTKKKPQAKTTSKGRPAGKRRNSRNNHPKRQLVKASRFQTKKSDKKVVPLPEVKKGHVRIVPLGGIEEVGKNMTVVETYDDIFIFDMGFQFVSEEEIPGIDYIIPNTTYLEERKHKIRAVLITHGHLDHIGGIPFMLERLGFPPIYTANMTEMLIRKRNEEFPDLKDMNIIPFKADERMKIGSSYIKSFPVTHSIPDSMGFSIETPMGNVVISGDLRLDHTAGIPSEKEERVWGEIAKQDNLFFMCDSTNAEQSGFSTDEHTVLINLDRHIRETKNRMIIGTFASQFERLVRIIGMAETYGKKVVLEGRSIKTNIEIAQRSGLLKPKKGTIISAEEIPNYPPDRILVLATGAQGEEFAALMRIATGKHKQIKLTSRDTILLSSSVIPGNEISVQRLKDALTRFGLEFINYRTSDIHTSGHGNIQELVWINQKVNAKYFMPGYGYHSMLRSHAAGVIKAGFPKKNVVIADNGFLVDISPTKELSIRKEKAPSSITAVDGFHIGDVQDVVIRDRKALTKDGIFVIVSTVDARTGKIQKSPDIISRGFVYLRESQDLLRQARYIAKKTIEDNTIGVHTVDYDFVKEEVAENVKKFLFQQTAKRPMVLPVVLAV